MNFKTGFMGFLIGGLTGAMFALLYAPQSGEETRQILAENSQKLKEDTFDSIQQAQDLALDKMNEAQIRMDTLNRETKELLSQFQSNDKSTLESQKEILEDGNGQTKEAVAA